MCGRLSLWTRLIHSRPNSSRWARVAVNDRIERRYYDGAARAYAMRWLNDRALARSAGVAKSVSEGATILDLTRRAQTSARWAMVAATFAIIAALISTGVVFYAQRSAQIITAQRQAAAPGPPILGQASEVPQAKRVHHRPHGPPGPTAIIPAP